MKALKEVIWFCEVIIITIVFIFAAMSAYFAGQLLIFATVIFITEKL